MPYAFLQHLCRSLFLQISLILGAIGSSFFAISVNLHFYIHVFCTDSYASIQQKLFIEAQRINLRKATVRRFLIKTQVLKNEKQCYKGLVQAHIDIYRTLTLVRIFLHVYKFWLLWIVFIFKIFQKQLWYSDLIVLLSF